MTNTTIKHHGVVHNLIGSRYKNWKIVSYNGNSKWLCRCDCGEERIIRVGAILQDTIKKCKCLKVKQELTSDTLKSRIFYDPNTGYFNWILPKGRGIKFGDLAGSKSNSGYTRISFSGKMYQAHRLAWLYVMGEWPKNHIDHINGIRDDNRLCNLREANPTENVNNSKKRADNTSGFRGLYFNKNKNKWDAECVVNKINIFLGRTIHLSKRL